MTYKKRYTDKNKQNSYENACDCLYFGYNRNFWITCGNHTEKEKNEIWKQAYNDMIKSL